MDCWEELQSVRSAEELQTLVDNHLELLPFLNQITNREAPPVPPSVSSIADEKTINAVTAFVNDQISTIAAGY